VRARSTWKSVALIAHAMTLILGSIAMVALANPLTFVLAVCDHRHISSDFRS